MNNIDTVVQNILYSPSNKYGPAETRVQAAKADYQQKLSEILLKPTGDY